MMPIGLSIRDVARRTGVPPATLRSWEARYGRPRPERLAGGHRRYREEDVAWVEEVLRRRSTGLSLPAAMAQAATPSPQAELSVFAGLRRRHPDLQPQLVRKPALLALTRAVEDECCARAERPMLFACFQRAELFAQSAARWAELTRTAETAVIFADFADVADFADGSDPTELGATESSPLRVPLSPAAPLRREWVLVCDAPDYPACVAGWERPGDDAGRDGHRRFETLWAVDPVVVRDAARICAGLLQTSAPDLACALAGRLAANPPPASADLRRAAGLLNRMVGYLAR